MTHTLETTGIARVVARALRAERGSRRGDRARPRHRPHAVRPRRRGGARRARCATLRRPLPPQRAVAADRRAPQPDPRGARRHPHAHRRRGSRRRSRARSSASSTGSPTSTTTSTTRSATASSSEDDLPRDEIDVLGATGSKRIDTLVHDLIETSAREGDIAQSDEVGAAMLALRVVHVRARLPRARDARRARAAHGAIRRIFDAARRARRRPRGDHRVHRRDDRPLRARVRCAASDVRRIKDTTVEAVQAGRRLRRRRRGADAAAQGRRAAQSAAARSTRSARRASRSTRRQGLYYCFGCGKGGDLISLRPGDAGPRLRGRDRMARRPLPHPARVRGRLAGARRRGATAARRLQELLEDAAIFYERALWETAGRLVRARLPGGPRPRRGDLPRVPARARTRRQHAHAQGAREGLHRARSSAPRASCGRAATTTSSGGCVFPLADARGRVIGFQARRLHDDDPLRAKYVNTPESELFHKRRGRLRARQGALGDREAGSRLRRRGEHRRDRAPPGRVRAGRRLHGDGADRAAATRARAADEAALARLRRRRRRRSRRRSAGWSSRSRRASTSTSSRFRPASTLPTIRRASRRSLRSAKPYVLYRARIEMDGADDREAGFRRAKAILDGFPEGPDKLAAQRLVTDRLGTTVQFGSARSRRPAPPRTPRALSTLARGSSGTPWRGRSRTRSFGRCSRS